MASTRPWSLALLALLDLRRGRLPTYSFISPNLCNDMHDCSVGTGDRFLAHLVPTLLRAAGPKGYVVLTWDEGTSDRGCCGGSRGGRIPTIVAGGSCAAEHARVDRSTTTACCAPSRTPSA